MSISLQRWLRIALFNLLIIAGIGIILRYKIVYPLPFIDQKNLLHAHSHFAFSGWITQALMALMVAYLSTTYGQVVFKRYRWILYANLVTSYGMLFSFPFEGYGKFSISFSTLCIITNYIFTIRYWKDLNNIPGSNIGHHWFKAALIFNVISSFGAFALAYMMATKEMHLTEYLAAVYFFLHFQYNGWFFFAGMGLLVIRIFVPVINSGTLKKIFWLFALACVPAYFLSALWMSIPVWVYILVVIAAFAQLAGWIWMLVLVKQQLPHIKVIFSLLARWLLALSAIALSVKLLLQLGSTIPSLSNLAFGFRPIVIGYLHLVLLGVITLMLLGYMTACQFIAVNNRTRNGMIIFAAGIIINEVMLMVQGISGMDYVNIPYVNETLLFTALILFSGILVINISQLNNSKTCVKS